MFNLIRADLFKMYKSQAIKILFGITTLCALAMTVMAYLIPKGLINSEITGIGFMISDISMISILGAVISGIFICGDFDNKTINDAISCGKSRIDIIVSKSIVLFCGITFILLPYAIITGIALSTRYELSMGSVGIGFLNIQSLNSGNTYQLLDYLKLLIITVSLMIVYAAQLSICVPLAFVLKKPVLVVAIFYGLSILCGQLSGLSSSVFKRIYAFTPFGGHYMFLSMDSKSVDISNAICVSLIFIIVMLTITYTVFRKSEIK